MQDFQHSDHPNQSELTHEDAAIFESRFNSQSQNAGIYSVNSKGTWGEEYKEYQYLETQVVVDETELEEAFKQHSQVSEWESQFARIDKSESTSDWQSQFSTFDPKISLDQTDEISKQFEAMWRRDNPDFEVLEDIDYDLSNPNNWGNEFMSDFPQGEYIFEPENIYLSHGDPLGEAKRLLQEGGTLQQASMAFEAALQKEHRDNSVVWLALGELQAENEKETAAIRALEQAVNIDENNLQAYLVSNYTNLKSLAVSYMNEGYDYQAYNMLENWIRRKYIDIPIPDGSTVAMSPRERIMDTFLTAARMGAGQNNMDPDVQMGLGVLAYGGGEFEKAADCFSSALNCRPNVAK